MIIGIPRNDQVSKDPAGVRLGPPSQPFVAASPNRGFAHGGAVDGICIANFPEETVAAPKISIRMP